VDDEKFSRGVVVFLLDFVAPRVPGHLDTFSAARTGHLQAIGSVPAFDFNDARVYCTHACMCRQHTFLLLVRGMGTRTPVDLPEFELSLQMWVLRHSSSCQYICMYTCMYAYIYIFMHIPGAQLLFFGLDLT